MTERPKVVYFNIEGGLDYEHELLEDWGVADDIELVDETVTLAPGETSCLEGTVDVSEMMGSSVHLHMTSLGQDVIAVVNTMDATDPTFADRHNVGERVEYAFTGNAIHLFDKETGTNLEF